MSTEHANGEWIIDKFFSVLKPEIPLVERRPSGGVAIARDTLISMRSGVASIKSLDTDSGV